MFAVLTIMYFIMIPGIIMKILKEADGAHTKMKVMRELSFVISDIGRFFLLYFGSCTPKPPSRSKFKKLIEALSSRKQKIQTQRA